MANSHVEIKIDTSENEALALFPFHQPYFDYLDNIIKPAFKIYRIKCESVADDLEINGLRPIDERMIKLLQRIGINIRSLVSLKFP